jgi:hypothetical protein
MTDYSKLVKALRTCIGDKKCFEKECRYWSELGCMDGNICCDAADAIEELEAKKKELHGRIEDKELQIDMLTADNTNYEIAIDELKAQLPKRGEWELIDGAEPMRWGCSRCKYLSWETSNYCPRCGAKMFASDINVLNKNDTTDGPIITPCRGCSDYDGYGECKSKGGCARAKMEVQDADT